MQFLKRRDFHVLYSSIGAPSFLLAPPSSLLVPENSNFTIKIQMDGNPKPTALFTWPHDNSITSTIEATQIYPFIYEAIFNSNNIPASYCGRTLDTRIMNTAGTSSLRKTNVTMLRKYCRLMTTLGARASLIAEREGGVSFYFCPPSYYKGSGTQGSL